MRASPHRRLVTLDGRAWLEARQAAGCWLVEFHRPDREHSVGWVDEPVKALGRDLLETVAAALPPARRAPALAASLAGRIQDGAAGAALGAGVQAR